MKTKTAVALSVALTAVACALIGIAIQEEGAAGPLARLTDSSNVAAAKGALSRRLIDPRSAQYRHVTEFNDGVVCGEVNAKNALGGYSGFRVFVYNARSPGQLDVEPDHQLVNLWCSNEADKAGVERAAATAKAETEAAQRRAEAERPKPESAQEMEQRRRNLQAEMEAENARAAINSDEVARVKAERDRQREAARQAAAAAEKAKLLDTIAECEKWKGSEFESAVKNWCARAEIAKQRLTELN
jgi:hypothetical protein